MAEHETGNHQISRNEAFLVAAAAAAGIFLRLFCLGKACLEIEQATWLYYALQPTGEMLKWLGVEITGVLDIFVIHALSRLSDSPDIIKLYQVALFPLTMWFLIKMSKLVFDNNRPGIYASFVFAIAPLFIQHTQLLRYHALAMFLATGAALYYVNYITRGEKRSAVIFAIYFALAALTHYYIIALLPALAAGSVFCIKPFGRKRVFAALAAGAAALLPCAPVFISQYSRRIGAPADASGFFDYVFSRALINIPDAMLQFTLGAHYPVHADFFLAKLLLFGACALFLALLAALAAQRVYWTAGPRRRFFFIAVAVSVILPFFSVPFAGMPYVPKFLLPFAPLFFLLISGVISEIKMPAARNFIFAALMVILSISLALYYRVLGPRPDFRDAVRFIAQNAGPRDTVVIVPGYYFFMFDAYGPVRAKLLSVPQGDFLEDKRKSKDIVTPESMDAFARENLAGVERVWVFYGDGNGLLERIPADPERSSFLWFEKHYSPIQDYNFYISPLMPQHGKPLGVVRLYEKK